MRATEVTHINTQCWFRVMVGAREKEHTVSVTALDSFREK